MNQSFVSSSTAFQHHGLCFLRLAASLPLPSVTEEVADAHCTYMSLWVADVHVLCRLSHADFQCQGNVLRSLHYYYQQIDFGCSTHCVVVYHIPVYSFHHYRRLETSTPRYLYIVFHRLCEHEASIGCRLCSNASSRGRSVLAQPQSWCPRQG